MRTDKKGALKSACGSGGWMLDDGMAEQKRWDVAAEKRRSKSAAVPADSP